MQQCKITGCDGKYYVKGFCRRHYRRHRAGFRGEDLAFDGHLGKRRKSLPCSIEGCDRPRHRHEYCRLHRERIARGVTGDALTAPSRHGANKDRTCSVDGCGKPSYSKGLCRFHYHRAWRGTPLDAPKPVYRLGERYSPLPGHLNSQGYRVVKDNHTGRQVMVHRLVMEEHIGRPLHPHETVHHKHGDREDNRIGKLELWSTSQPSGQRVRDKVEWAREILAEYGDLYDSGKLA